MQGAFFCIRMSVDGPRLRRAMQESRKACRIFGRYANPASRHLSIGVEVAKSDSPATIEPNAGSRLVPSRPFDRRRMPKDLEECYLCGQPLLGERSADHTVPRHLIKRDQAKAKGYDYGGRLPTHGVCNNRFGPEAYNGKALKLLEVLFGDENSYYVPPGVTINGTKIMALDSSRLSFLSGEDLKFFRIADVRGMALPEALAAGIEPRNLKKDALYISLSVLFKSAAALLVKRKLGSLPHCWRVFAVPFFGDIDPSGFDEVSGEATKPFDEDVRVWIAEQNPHSWLVIYQAGRVLVHLIFVFSRHRVLRQLHEIYRDGQIFYFSGWTVNDVLVKGWTEV